MSCTAPPFRRASMSPPPTGVMSRVEIIICIFRVFSTCGRARACRQPAILNGVGYAHQVSMAQLGAQRSPSKHPIAQLSSYVALTTEEGMLPQARTKKAATRVAHSPGWRSWLGTGQWPRTWLGCTPQGQQRCRWEAARKVVQGFRDKGLYAHTYRGQYVRVWVGVIARWNAVWLL